MVTLFLAILFLLISSLLFVPLAAYFTSRLGIASDRRGPLVLGISTVFLLSAFSIGSSWSYGVLGANSFIYVLLFLFLASISSLVFGGVREAMKLLGEFRKTDVLQVIVIPVVLILTRTYWRGLFSLQLAAGSGPDTAQNLMVVSASKLNQGSWASSRDYFFNLMSVESFQEGLYRIYQVPSFVDQAAIDYLVYGTRWGLSIPFSQLLRVDKSWIVSEQALVLGFSLVAIGLLVYGAILKITESAILSFLAALSAISSAPLLIQFFNGGMAQVWATPGLVLLSILILLFLSNKGSSDPNFKYRLIPLSMVGWLASAVTYLDSAMVIAALVIALSLILFLNKKSRQTAFSLLIAMAGSGLIASLFVAPYSWAASQTLGIRMKLAGGTGIEFKSWPLPSETLGLFDVWTGDPLQGRGPAILFTSLVVSAAILFLLLCRIPRSDTQNTRILGITILLLWIVVAAWSFTSGPGRNYSFVKVSTYLTPLLLLLLFTRWNLLVSHLSRIRRARVTNLKSTIPIIFVTSIFATATSTSGSLYETAEYVVPAAQFNIYEDQPAQRELSEYNYIATYRPISNVLGALGNVHWISKAPNDFDLSTRADKELRLICFAGDPACKPSTPEIVSALNPYGIRVFQAPLTTQEFINLAIIDRYYAAADAMGQERFEVPERYLGGNPLLYEED
jgi:hypothetical protein